MAQGKHDYTWFVGYPPLNVDRKFGGTTIRFHTNPPAVSLGKIGLEMGSCTAVMCDTSGQMAFYSNGFKIYNSAHQLMEGGDSLNAPGQEFAWSYHQNVCYSTYPGILALPIPDRPDRYGLFHFRYMDWTDILALEATLYTEVDMSANGGLGKVTSKNRLLLRDTFDDNIAAVRHGNGRDWWITTFKFGQDKVFLWLLTPQGVKGPIERSTGLPWKADYYTRAGSAFSPDGSLFARIDHVNHLQLFRFDRCTGKFSRSLQLQFPGDTLDANGVVFSPNGRYLYATTGTKLYQFDCQAANIQESKILIGVYDDFIGFHKLATTFYQMRLAPEKKIYMTAANGVNYLHIIHAPDEAGIKCGFEQHALELPAAMGFCLPIYPNYQLQRKINSPCDTLYTEPYTGNNPLEDIYIAPTLASEEIFMKFPPLSAIRVRVYNAVGVLMDEWSGVNAPRFHTIQTLYWPAGVYFVQVLTQEYGAKTFKLVVAH